MFLFLHECIPSACQKQGEKMAKQQGSLRIARSRSLKRSTLMIRVLCYLVLRALDLQVALQGWKAQTSAYEQLGEERRVSFASLGTIQESG